MKDSREFEHLKQIFHAAVERVDPYQMIKKHVEVTGSLLKIDIEDGSAPVDLKGFNRIFVTGCGKATAKMAKAVEEIFTGKISAGVVSVKYGHTEHLDFIRTIESGHPIPDENSVKAAGEIIKLSKQADDKTLIINLISGGGSALLASPLEYSAGPDKVKLTLKDIQQTTEVLLASGAPIDEMNCIRKHISGIKGGKLARLMYPATLINLILSDVIGDRLDSIASGLTTADETTYEDALQIIEKYEIREKVPVRVLNAVEDGARGLIEETPKKNDRIFNKVFNVLIGTNYTALLAASHMARSLGYNNTVISSQVIGEAREAAKIFAGIAKDIKKHDLLLKKPACVIGGGETTVTIKGSGKGGRNQELALSFLSEMKKDPEQTGGIYFLSAATDGNDGPTDAAGAFASHEILKECKRVLLKIEDFLKNNDSYTFFEKTGSLFKTGPTNTNVCDLQILIVK